MLLSFGETIEWLEQSLTEWAEIEAEIRRILTEEQPPMTALTKTYTLTELINHYTEERRNARALELAQAEAEQTLRSEQRRIEDEIQRSHLRGVLATYPVIVAALALDTAHIDIRDGKPVAYGMTVIEEVPVSTAVALHEGKFYVQLHHEFEDGQIVSEKNALPADNLRQVESLIAAMGAELLESHSAIVTERVCKEMAEQERCQKEERERAAKLEAAQRIIDIAQDYVLAWEEYHAAARRWAESETERLWKPWSAWEVTSAPDSVIPNEDGEIYTETFLVLDEPSAFRGNPAAVIRTVNQRSGAIERTVLGSFVSARLLTYTTPVIDKKLPWHKQFFADSFVVNVPPIVSEDPTPMPPAPKRWYETVREELPDFDASYWTDWGAEGPEEIVKETPERLVYKHGRWLPEGEE